MPDPGQVWRALGVGLFLALIGVGGTLLAVTVFPLLALISRNPETRRRRIQGMLHHLFRLYCRGIDLLRVADVEFVGTERLGDLSGTLIIANHPSLLDVVMIMALVPRVQCVVKAGLWSNPFFRLTVAGAGYIRNDLPPERLLEACLEGLRRGETLIVFPEGTRTPLGALPRFQRGFANLATLAPSDLQTIFIEVDPPLLAKGQVWWRAPQRRTRFRLEVGERIPIAAFLDQPFRPIAERHLVRHLEVLYAARLGPETR